MFTGAAIAVGLLVAVSIVLKSDRAPSSFSHEQRRIAAFVDYEPAAAWRQSTCFLTPADPFTSFRGGECLTPPHQEGRRALLLGDSMAAQLLPGLRAALPGWTIAQANAADCRPFVMQPNTLDPEYAPNCVAMSHLVFGPPLTDTHYDAVLLAARWQPADLQQLHLTLAWLQAHGQHAFVFGPLPEYDMPLPRLLAFALRRDDATLPQRHLLPAVRSLDARMKTLAASDWHVPYLSAFAALCHDPATCTVWAQPGIPLQFDTHHLTPRGAVLYLQRLGSAGPLLDAGT